MTDAWRKKTYYKPRVLVSTSDVLASTFPDCVVCIKGGNINLLRNLLQYAHRRSTFVSEYHTNYYLAPTDEEWALLESQVADLEYSLMNCEEYGDMLDELALGLRQNTGLMNGYTEDMQAVYPADYSLPDGAITETGDDACDLAQIWYGAGYENITEVALPLTRFGWDNGFSLLAAVIGTLTGGPVVAAGAYAIAEALQNLLQVFYNAAETNLVNWLDTYKEDIVCAIYTGILDNETIADAWAQASTDMLAFSEGISGGDMIMINLFMGRWAGRIAQEAIATPADWVAGYLQADYCDDCPGVLTPGYWYYNFRIDTEWYTNPPNPTYYGPNHYLAVAGTIYSYGPTITGVEAGTYDYDITIRGFAGINQSWDGHVLLSYTTDGENWQAGVSRNTQYPYGAWGEYNVTGQVTIPENVGIRFELQGGYAIGYGDYWIYYDWLEATLTVPV